MTLHVVKRADALPNSRVAITWQDGSTDVVDLSSLLAKGGVFAALRDPAAFAAVRIGERGRSLVWRDAEGDDLDLCADALWRLAREASAAAA